MSIPQGGNQKARDFFIKNKAPIDGKIPEKYNSRAAAAYRGELLRAVEDDMRKNSKKYASSDKAGDAGKADNGKAGGSKDADDEWGWAGTPKASTSKTAPAPAPAAPKTETPTASKAKSSTPGYSSALARSGSPPGSSSSKSKLGGSRLAKAVSVDDWDTPSQQEEDDADEDELATGPRSGAAAGKGKSKTVLDDWNADDWVGCTHSSALVCAGRCAGGW